MNLQTQIRPELWLAIQGTYEAQNYSHAVLDAMHYLSDLLRERAGVDGDGVSLVGQALGGDSPRLRVNKLQTEAERNVQKGVQDLLRGLYRAIRNPRSHEQVEDGKPEADAIICFIDYLLGILVESQPPFVLADFLCRVLDPDFVESANYAELLAAEVPGKRRLDTLITIYRRKGEGSGGALKYMVGAMLEDLTDEQTADFLAVVADELRTTGDDGDVIRTLQLLPPALWPRLDESARLRTESKLIKSISEGEVEIFAGTLRRGALGTWARDFLTHFTLKNEAWHAVRGRLAGDLESRQYIVDYLMGSLPILCETASKRDDCIALLCEAVVSGDSELRSAVSKYWWLYPTDWQEKFRSILSAKDPDALQQIEHESVLPF